MEIKTQSHTIARAIELALVLSLLVVGGIVLPVMGVNQFVIGPIVNAALIYSALRLYGKIKIATIICVPSVFALGLGILGVTSIYAMLMIPAIWLGNTALVLVFKYAKKNYALTACAAITTKVSIIFLGFHALLWCGAIPNGGVLAATMFTMFGVYQIITATIGATIAFGAIKIAGRNGK